MKRQKRTSIWKKTLMVASVCLLFSGCFIFYDGSMDGFAVDGIYDGGNPNMVSSCSDDDIRSSLEYNNQSFDNLPDDNRSGSIAFRVGNDCFPLNTLTGFSRFDFVSPSLTSWNDITGFNFTMMSTVGGFTFPVLRVQPLLEIQKPDGSTTFLRMEDDLGAPIFLELTRDTEWHTFTFERPPESIDPTDNVIGLRVRVFIADEVIPALISGTDYVYLDTVVPLRR